MSGGGYLGSQALVLCRYNAHILFRFLKPLVLAQVITCGPTAESLDRTSAMSHALAYEEKDDAGRNEKKELADLPPVGVSGVSISAGSDILSLGEIDPALDAKLHLVNNVRIPAAPPPPATRPCKATADLLKGH